MRILIALIWLLSASSFTTAAFTNGSDRLLVGDYMTANQYLASTDGRFRFYLQSDGNLVLRVVSTSQTLWSSATNGKNGVRLNMQSDGNLVLRTSLGLAVWSSGTNGKGANRLVLQNDGRAVLVTSAGASVWSVGTAQPPADTTRPVITLTGSATMSVVLGGTFTDPGATATDNVDGNITSRIVKTGSVNTATVGTYTLSYNVKDNAGNAATTVTRTVNVTLQPFTNGSDRLQVNEYMSANQYMASPDGQFRFNFQGDGNLVLRNASGSAIWASGTNGQGGERLSMQSDGNLVLRNASGSAVWSSGTGGSGGARFVMQNDGNAVIYTSGGVFVWGTTQASADTTRPVITLTGSATMSITQGSTFTDPGATATDDRDGNITSRIARTGSVNTGTLGTYTLNYNVSDNAGNAAISVSRTVTVTSVADTTRPVITLTGSATMSISQGSTFTDPGATATDNVDGNITSRIVKTGSVNTGTAGTYTLSYNVRDNAGNFANTVTRSVIVTASASNAIPLPIEVLGSAGAKKTVSFQLNDPTGITHLYVRCNACGFHDLALDKGSKVKATVRVNGGSAVALKHFTENGQVYGNSGIRIIGGEALYGGIGGTFRTVRFTVPVSGLKAGTNTLTFEQVNREGASIGFRILELNLLQNGDLSRTMLSDMDFVEDDPRDWNPPRNTSTDIARGETLWRQRNKLYDIGYDMTDGQGNGQGTINGQMRASCSDCHAEDGRDLKYFNFSNEAIIERAKFHAMTQIEAEQVASYIRYLDIPVVTQARPWNPTYQPGPGMDSRPVYEWAAGAGVDAILDKDSDMAPYLFPRGTAIGEVRAVVDRYKTLNFRELPINIPMPEWNQWLPLIHPDDAFNTSASAINQDARGNNVGMPYYLKMYTVAKDNPTPANLGGLSKGLKVWLQRDLTCVSNGPSNTDPYRAINGAVMTSLRMPFPRVTADNCTSVSRASLANIELAKRGLTAWATVKLWEINHSQELEERSQNVGRSICSGGRCINASETRGWQADGRNVFDRPPHFTGVDPKRRYLSQSEMQGIFESNTWYHLNMVINPGYRVTMPSHFAYTYSHVELLSEYSKVNQGYRFWATMIKQRQLQTNGRYGLEEGLDLRTAQPHIYYGTARSTTKTDAQGGVGQPLWGRLATAMVEDFVADANNATAQNWADARGNSEVQARNSTLFSPCSGTCTFDIGPYQGRNTYRVIPKLRQIGVEENAIQRLIDWGVKTWPNGPWGNVR